MVDDSKKPNTSNQSIEQIDYFMDTFKIDNYNVNNSKLSSPNNWTPFDYNNNDNINENNYNNEGFSVVVQQMNYGAQQFQQSYQSSQDENQDDEGESDLNQEKQQQSESLSNSQQNNCYQNGQEQELLTPPIQPEAMKAEIQFFSAEGTKPNGNFQRNGHQNSQFTQLQFSQQQPGINQFPFYGYYSPIMYQQLPQFPIPQPVPISQRKVSNHTNNNTNNKINNNTNNIRYSGRLKFFDENKNYGFLVKDDNMIDIFVHYDDLAMAGMTKDFLKTAKQGNIIRFSFSCLDYVGKYDRSTKAVDLEFIENKNE